MTVARRWFLGLVLASLCVGGARAQTREPNQHFFQPLLGDLKAELAAAARDGRKGVLLVYEMDECPFCDRFHRTVLREVRVQDWYRQHFAVFRIDVKGMTPVSGFDGKDFTEGAFAASQKVRATPTSVFYDLSGKEVARFTGPTRDVAEFMALGDFVASGAYRSGTFADHRRARSR